MGRDAYARRCASKDGTTDGTRIAGISLDGSPHPPIIKLNKFRFGLLGNAS